MTDRSIETSYDLVPLPSLAHPLSHPNRLATLATLFGMRPAALDHCRVLELGCASGGNLIPMAVEFPDSAFVGIDLSARQIAAGHAAVQSLGLRNIDLGQADILEVPDEWGVFDYIITHDVYSWVQPAVQEKILSICKNCLAPHGVAYVSYKTFPGSHPRSAVREMMEYHTRKITEPQSRVTQARALLNFLADSVSTDRVGYRMLVKEEQQRLAEKPDPFLIHDELEEVNSPVYFHEFAANAARWGLQFLAEADIRTMMTFRLPPDVSARLSQMAPDLMAREQYLDFLTNRAGRETLLCHQHISLRREIEPDDLRKFHFASRARSVSTPVETHSDKIEEFSTPQGIRISSDQAVGKGALRHLAEIWPQSGSFDALLAATRVEPASNSDAGKDGNAYDHDTRVLAETLYHGFTAGAVELFVYAPQCATEPGERPQAFPFARLQATQNAWVTNLRHEVVHLDDLTRRILVELDGSRDRTALVEILARLVSEQNLIVQHHGRPVTQKELAHRLLANGVNATLHLLGQSALLVK